MLFDATKIETQTLQLFITVISYERSLAYQIISKTYLEFVSPLVILEVPSAAGDDHEDLLLVE